ncbi:MAG: RDD family protein [Saprospiraceae bacterium]
MSEIPIITTQNVVINFTAAEINDRILAYLTDSVIKWAYLIFISNYISDMSFKDLVNDTWSINAIFILSMLPFICYTFLQESLLEGQTIGKKLLGIKVVKIDGFQATTYDYFVRWAFRVLDIISSFGLIGFISINYNTYHQRVGDIAAGTGVIKLRNKTNISHTILMEIDDTYEPVFQNVIRFSDNDMRIIKENFERAMDANDHETLLKLRHKIKEISGIESEMGHYAFFRTILRDYNYYTGNM